MNKEVKYTVVAKNRFTQKVREKHSKVSIDVVYQVQDYYMLRPWIKVEITAVEVWG